MYKLSSVCADKASVNIKTSIPNVVTVIHTANPNCVYCVQSISLAHVHVNVSLYERGLMPSQACFASYVSAMPASVHMELKFVSVSGTRTIVVYL